MYEAGPPWCHHSMATALRELLSLRAAGDKGSVDESAAVAAGTSNVGLAAILRRLADNPRYFPARQRAAFLREAAHRLHGV